jgi:hypothetical protein
MLNPKRRARFTIHYLLFTIHSQKGQAMPYFFMMMVALVMSWMMLINVGKLMTERIMMQNAADNAALSVATYRARVLNKLGRLNHTLACLLYGTEAGVSNYFYGGAFAGPYGVCSPVPVYVPEMMVDNQQKIAAVPDIMLLGMGKCASGTSSGSDETSQTISSIRNLVKGMVTMQDAIRLPYPGGAAVLANNIAKIQQKSADGSDTGADNAAVIPWGGANGYKLGLLRNENGIKYFSTKTIYISVPPIPVVLPPGAHAHVWLTEEYAQEDKSWLYADKEEFYKHHKITVLATKNAGTESSYPFAAGLFGNITWPSIQTMASAAVYTSTENTADGPMFTIEENGSPGDKISPAIKAFRNAEKGGWDAHLVPLGSPYIH